MTLATISQHCQASACDNNKGRDGKGSRLRVGTASAHEAGVLDICSKASPCHLFGVQQKALVTELFVNARTSEQKHFSIPYAGEGVVLPWWQFFSIASWCKSIAVM
jgi:hypothetical protein